MNKDLVAYALDFVGYVIQNSSEKDLAKVKSIILFGSVARGTATFRSDLDLFFDVIPGAILQRRIDGFTKSFLKSTLYRNYWRLLGMRNDIRPIVGELEKWKDLNVSLVEHGLVLFGKYHASVKGKQMVLLFWDPIKPEGKRIFIAKKLHGWRFQGKKYAGLIEKTKALKLGPNTLFVPLENSRAVVEVFKQKGVPVHTLLVTRA